eukprot:6211254-Pleurochrysis_carterae.AAC.5
MHCQMRPVSALPYNGLADARRWARPARQIVARLAEGEQRHRSRRLRTRPAGTRLRRRILRMRRPVRHATAHTSVKVVDRAAGANVLRLARESAYLALCFC